MASQYKTRKRAAILFEHYEKALVVNGRFPVKAHSQ